MSSLSLQSVSKTFGTTIALDDVSLALDAAGITALIGRSGCGKSTLLKLCNGLLTPDRGTVQVLGEPLDYRDLPRQRRQIGYAVQGTGLFPHLSIRENITLLAVLAGWSQTEVDRRLDELLALTQLEAEQLERYPHQLSGGQQQRVGLCRAMMLKPRLLLLDEPFAAIDPITRSDIHQALLSLYRAEPTAVLLVTHDIREALQLADRIVLLEEGKIRFDHSKTAMLEAHPGLDPDQILQLLMAQGAAA
jgi:osmoprotectant transport system ATP-binding protein